MLRVLADKIKEHILSNLVSYIILITVFSVGIMAGAYIYNQYTPEEITVLFDFWEEAKEAYLNGEGDKLDIFKNSLLSSLGAVILVWALGFTVIGIPAVFFIMLKKGFVFGIITNFLVTNFPEGIITSLILLFSESCFFLPALYVAAVYSISLSKTITGMLSGKIRVKVNLKHYVLFYLVMLFVIMFVLVIYSLLEAYFTGNVLSWLFKMNS